MPFFTIILPTYNRPLELNRAVSSIIKQSFPDFEIIIVNNGNSPVVDNFGDERIRILSEPRKGANYARNTGIENAQGEFICFLDDDDEYLENHLETLRQLILKNNKAEALYRTFTRVCSVNKECVDQQIRLKGKDETSLEHLYINSMLVMHCVCCHKNILKNIKFDPSIPVGQDYHLWSRIVVKYPLIEVPIITTIYNKTDNSISSPSLEKYQNYIRVYGDLFKIDTVVKEITQKTRKATMFRYHDLLLSCYYNELTFAQFWKYSFGAFRNNGSFLFSVHYLKLLGKFLLSKVF